LQVWELKDEQPRNRGDVLVLVDRSGSMDGARMTFARALALCTVMRAVKDNRRAILTMFAGSGDVESLTILPGDEPGLRNAIALLSRSADGGTDVAGAIRHAVGQLPNLRSPDTLLITDGQFAEPDAATVAPMKANGGRVVVVTLGFEQAIGFADEVVALETTNATDAANVLRLTRR